MSKHLLHIIGYSSKDPDKKPRDIVAPWKDVRFITRSPANPEYTTLIVSGTAAEIFCTKDFGEAVAEWEAYLASVKA